METRLYKEKYLKGSKTHFELGGFRATFIKGSRYRIDMKQIQGKLLLVRVSGEFELTRVQVIGI